MPADPTAPTKEQIWQTIQSTQPYLRANQMNQDTDLTNQQFRVASTTGRQELLNHIQDLKQQLKESKAALLSANRMISNRNAKITKLTQQIKEHEADKIYIQHAEDYYKSINEDGK